MEARQCAVQTSAIEIGVQQRKSIGVLHGGSLYAFSYLAPINLFILLTNDVPRNNRRAQTGFNIRVPSKVVSASPAGEFSLRYVMAPFKYVFRKFWIWGWRFLLLGKPLVIA